MEAKFGNFSELANLLSVKSRVSSDLTVLFERFSLGRLLSRMGIRKEQGYSLVQLIMALCIFRVCGETIHSAYMANFHGLVETGKNEVTPKVLCLTFGVTSPAGFLLLTNFSGSRSRRLSSRS